MKREIYLSEDCRLRQLSPANLKIVQGLCEKCTDYFLLSEGTSPSENAAAEIFDALPPGKTYTDKYIFGIEHSDGKLAGVIDLVKNYPSDGVWMLGLLLLDPEERGQGIGRAAHRALATWAGALGAESFRIGVIEENRGGKQFWEALGYTKEKEIRLEFGKKEHQIHVMTLNLRMGGTGYDAG